ncbi:MAG: polysaccharide pyruvyl transferase family protein [Selenomonadaceae bacterium]|nr:polysaccharide pyruvyl transferase family protein [Selenomonadaceae bacterium]MBR3745414.1 polysaccharide pyruvyl transferase family protein [Selenomonadaceae bacterium]
MRIAQITLNHYFNYGNVLQKFALNHTLKKFADSAEVLWLDGNKLFSEIGGRPKAQCVRFTERRDWEDIFRLREAVRQSKFKDFENLHIPTRFDFPYMEDIADEYDFFVVGSDQVWNPKWNRSYIFLEFISHEKKIAYAASIGHPTIPDEKKELFRRGISDFNYVSVREENAATLINELTGQTPPVVLDPVMLLTEDEWLAVAQKPTWLKEKYRRGFVLTYYLRKLPPPEVKKLAAELNLPVINLLDPLNYEHFTMGPAEFIWLFMNASLIFSNSFHGVAFSILFKRPFFNREIQGDGSGIAMSNRLVSLLKMFGLENRRTFGDKIFTAQEALTIDFSRRDEVFPLERAKAFKFLAEALGTEPREKNFGGDAQ